MPRSLGRSPIAYDQRTDKKVRARDLIEDGEIPGLMVSRREADSRHPQRDPVRVGPDRRIVYRPIPELILSAVDIALGYEADGDSLASPRMWLPDFPMTIGSFALEYAVSAATGTTSLDFSDAANSQYVTLIFSGI